MVYLVFVGPLLNSTLLIVGRALPEVLCNSLQHYQVHLQHLEKEWQGRPVFSEPCKSPADSILESRVNRAQDLTLVQAQTEQRDFETATA